MHPPARPILSPCIGVCRIDADGLCAGCHRSLAEIAGWAAMGDEARERWMDEILPQREAQRGDG